MSIKLDDVLTLLYAEFPDFPVTQEFRDVCYLVFSDLARELCNEAEYSTVANDVTPEFSGYLKLLDRLATEGDSDVRDLVMDTLDGLHGCEHRSFIEQYATPKLLEMLHRPN